MLVDYYRIFMWGAQPEAASPAAHQGARHCPLVTRSLVTGSRWWRGSWGRRSTGHWQTPTGARTLETETGPRVTLDTGDWDWPTLVTAATGNIADEADLSRALARRQPHSASDCIICKSHIFIPPPPSPHSRQPSVWTKRGDIVFINLLKMKTKIIISSRILHHYVKKPKTTWGLKKKCWLVENCIILRLYGNMQIELDCKCQNYFPFAFPIKRNQTFNIQFQCGKSTEVHKSKGVKR